MNVLDILAPWETVNAALGLSGPIRDEAHYAAPLALVDEAFERFGGSSSRIRSTHSPVARYRNASHRASSING